MERREHITRLMEELQTKQAELGRLAEYIQSLIVEQYIEDRMLNNRVKEVTHVRRNRQ